MGKKQPPLPVSVPDTKKETCPFPAAQLVCLWALISACAIAGAVVYDAAHYGDAVPPAAASSRWASRVPLTEAQLVAASAVEAAQLWLAAPQATAAALGLLLPSVPRRIRRALAFVALAAAAGNHYLWARVIGIVFVAAPGNYNLVINFVALVFFGGVVDVASFLALILSSSSGEDDDQ